MTAYQKLGFDIADFPNAYERYRNEINTAAAYEVDG